MSYEKQSLIILDDYQHVSSTLADWTPLQGLRITTLTSAMPADRVVDTLSGYTMVHAMRERTKFPRSVLEPLAKAGLRFITTTGLRNRGIDVEACRELGITVSGTVAEDNASAGTVEQTWALILAVSRRLLPEVEGVRAGHWQLGVGQGIRGKTLGIIGLGRLGKQVAEVGRAFGMVVQAWSPNLTKERAAEGGCELAPSLEALLRTSDVVTVHIVHSDRTTGMLGEQELAMLKGDAILVNTSRGPLIEEKALLDFIKTKKAGGVGLDVFNEEPLPLKHPLRNLERLVVSPHMGYVDDASYNAWWPQTVENIQAYLAGKPVRLM